jgi:hypothetical protein
MGRGADRFLALVVHLASRQLSSAVDCNLRSFSPPTASSTSARCWLYVTMPMPAVSKSGISGARKVISIYLQEPNVVCGSTGFPEWYTASQAFGRATGDGHVLEKS